MTTATKSPSVKLEWKQRARTETDSAARRTIWESRCGGYRVVKRQILFGGPTKDSRHPDVFRAERWCQYGTQFGWATISTHKSRGAATAACQHQARMWAAFDGAKP